MTDLLAIAATTLLLHASLFLGLAWLIERSNRVRRVATREYLWRSAVVGSVLSAALQLLLLPSDVPLVRVAFGPPVDSVVDERAGSGSPAGGRVSDASAQRVGANAPSVPSSAAAAPAPARSVATRPGADRVDAAHAVLPDATSMTTGAPASRVLRNAVFAALPWLLLAWALAAALAWLRVARAAYALRGLLRRSREVDAPEWHEDCAELAAHFGLARAPTLRRHAQIPSPLATPGNRVVIPDWALALPRAQRRALLAHEIAHLARRDPAWRLVLALWHGLLRPLPLARLALRRLDTLAEWQCDAAAARATGDARALAACLAQCLEQRLDPSFPALAAAMAAARSPLLQRAERLLEGVPMSSDLLNWRLRLAPLAAILAAAIAVPAFVVPSSVAAERDTAASSATTPARPARPAAPAKPAGPSDSDCEVSVGRCTSIHSRNGAMDISIGEPGRLLRYRSRGEVRFNDADDGLASLGSGAEVSWEETVGGEKRRIEYRGSGSGSALTARYWKNGNEQPLDADAKAWLARIVPMLLREAAIDVKGRVARLVARGGNDAVLAEVAQIRSDYAKGRYLGELLRTRTLDDTELDRALAAIGTIGSDYEKRQALDVALASQQLGKPQWMRVMEAAAGIGSDYERAQLLTDSAARVADDDELRGAWLKAGSSIGSDYERRRSLEALAKKTRGDAALIDILDAADGMGSDYEQRELLSQVARRSTNPNGLAPRYAQAVRRIGSDYEQREAITALLATGSIGRDGALSLLDAAAGIGSDFECREVLVDIARRLRDDTMVRDRVLQLAQRLSDFEREQVEDALGVARG